MLRHWIFSACALLGTTITIKTTTNEAIVTQPKVAIVIPSGLPENLQAPVEKATTQKTKHKKDNQSCPQFEETFKQYGLLPVDTFSYIAWRESGCNPKAINAKWDKKGNITWTLNKNGTYDSGLLQINSSWKTVTKKVCKRDISGLLELDCNLKVAKYLLDNGGLGHWNL